MGACIALPAFASLYSRGAFAKAANKLAPTRMAFVYVPNGAIPAAWWPAGDGARTSRCRPRSRRSRTCTSNCRSSAGCRTLSANAGPDGAGDHARASGTFLTGVRIKKTAGSDIRAGVSIDQVVANQIGHLTRFSSLELTCDAVRKVRRLRLGLRLRLRIQPRLAFAQPAAVAGTQSALRVRAVVRQRRAARARGESQAPASTNRIPSSTTCSTTRARSTRSSTAATGRSSTNTSRACARSNSASKTPRACR